MINLLYILVCLFATYGIISFVLELCSCFNKLSIKKFRVGEHKNERVDIICSFKNCEKYADYIMEGLTCGKYELLSDIADNVYIVNNNSSDCTGRVLKSSKWNIEKFKNLKATDVKYLFDNNNISE